MDTILKQEGGWKPIPLPLKTLFVVIAFWSVGAVMNLSNLLESGLPLLGVFVHGSSAFLVFLLLDIIGPLIFLYALWNRKQWGPKWAFAYIGLFIINGAVAFFTVRDQLGLPQILMPTMVSMMFLAVIYWKRAYFTQAD